MKALLAALLLMSSSAHAGFLHLCPAGAAPKDGVLATLRDGRVLVAQAGGTPVLVLLRQPVKTAAGTLYRLSGERTLDGSATSFHGNPERLRALLPLLERDFSAWSSFGGMALHGWR